MRTLSVMDHWFQMEMLWSVDEPMLEGYTTLSFAAGEDDRLRFRLLVGGVTYRHPGLLAKTVTTLDVLSGGRAELGLGAAWYEREHRGLGVPFPPLRERYERLEETIQICFQMWSPDNGSLRGHALPTGRDAVFPAARQLTTAAAADWRRGRTQDATARGDLRRCVQPHRRPRDRHPQGRRPPPALRGRGSRSGRDRGDGAVAVARRHRLTTPFSARQRPSRAGVRCHRRADPRSPIRSVARGDVGPRRQRLAQIG